MTLPANVPGIHHVTCITGDVQKNVDFYVGILGLRFIKKTVNFDVPDTYHIQVELAGEASDERWKPWPDSPVDPHHQIRSFHSVTLTEESDEATIHFLTDTMGFRKVSSEGNRTRFETGAGGPTSILDV